MVFTNVLKNNGIKISVNGKDQWTDKVFIERLWRSMKYEGFYLNVLCNFKDAEQQLAIWIDYYNDERPQFKLDELNLSAVHAGVRPLILAA